MTDNISLLALPDKEIFDESFMHAIAYTLHVMMSTHKNYYIFPTLCTYVLCFGFANKMNIAEINGETFCGHHTYLVL